MRLDKLDYISDEKFLDEVSSALCTSILNVDGPNVTILSCHMDYDTYHMWTVYGIVYRDAENRQKTVTVCVT